MRNWFLAGIAGGLIGVVLIVSVAARLGIFVVAIQRPDTHWFWYVSRAAGISASKPQSNCGR